MKNQKLGRGLDALFGEVDEAYKNEGSQRDFILEILLEDIKPNPFQPRKFFDEKYLIELSESIKKDGLLQPIVVKEDNGKYILIAGERRVRASKLANLEYIKAIVINSDEQQMRQFALIENIQREELNSIELAKAYNELLELHDLTHDELSSMIHKSRTHITNTLRLLQLSKYVQDLLIEKKITPGHAKVLVGLDVKQQELIINSIIGQKLNVRDTESMIQNLKKDNDKKIIKKDKVDYDFSLLIKSLKKINIDTKISSNKLTLEFSSQNEIDKLLLKLS